MTKTMVVLLCLVAVAFSATAQTNFKLSDTVRFNPNVKKGRLSSGIPYYFMQNARPAQRMELMLVVNAGAVLEDDDQNGLAHFSEHMAFNGTQNFPKQELVNFLESMGVRFGADLNAYTNADETVYMLTVPLDKPQNLIKAVQILRDWAGFVAYDETEINAERGVVMEEWRLGKGADDRVQEKHRGMMYYGSKYAVRDVIGDTNVLLRAPGENLRRFYRTWYRPENLAIIAVGDMDPNTLETYVSKYFGSPASSGERVSARPQILLPPHKETLISIASDPELQGARAEIVIKRRADTVHTYADYKTNIVREMMNEMLNQRLAELTRKNPPPYASAGTGDFRLAREAMATYGIATAADKNVLRSLNALLTEFERAKRFGFTSTELVRAKESTLSRIEKYYNERDKSESQQFARELSRHVLQVESVPGIIHEWEIFQGIVPTVTVEDVNAVAKSLITQENRVIMISVPEGNGFTKPTEQQVRDLLAAVEEKKIEAYVDAVPTKPLLEITPTPGKIVGLRTIPDVGATELTLSNGARVVYKKTDFKNDEILFSAHSWGGQSLAPEADHFTNMVAVDVMREGGIGIFDVNELSKLLNGKNVGISASVAMEQESINGVSTPKDLRTFFELLHLGFTAQRKDPQAFDAWKLKMKADLANKSKSPEAVFFDTLLAVSSNNHPRARTMSESAVDRVDLDKAYEFVKSRFKFGSDFTFYFVGNLDEEALKKYAETYIGSLPAAPSKPGSESDREAPKKAAPETISVVPLSGGGMETQVSTSEPSSPPMKETWKDVGLRTKKGQYSKVVYKGVDPKSTVLLAASGSMKYTPENRYDIVALCEVMEIQLREQMREEKGGVYFVSVQPNFSKIPLEEYSISVYFGCAPERVDELVATVKNEMVTLRTKAVPDSLLAKVREMQTKERQTNTKTNRFWLQVLSQFDRDAEPYSNVFLRDNFIKNLDAAQIKRAAERYLDGKNFAEFVLKPESSSASDAKPSSSSQQTPIPTKKTKKK
ncbi:MAG: insulinase family protein [Candidatus Kapabacteria bacterium]|nr:insulinase family protein [Candidatus Kapabacteria bacterium]